MRVGLELKIDVTKLDKNRFYKGEKGIYCTMTTFVNLDEEDRFGNHGFITQKKEKDEKGQLPILGNVKVFWSDRQGQQDGSADAPVDENEPF